MTDQEAVKEMFNGLSTAFIVSGIAIGVGLSFLGFLVRLAVRLLP